MADDDAALENQGTDKDGQHSEESPLEAKIRELESRTSQLSEELDKERKLNELLTSEDVPRIPYEDRYTRQPAQQQPARQQAVGLHSFDDDQREELSQWVPMVTQQITSTVLDVVQGAFQAEKNNQAFRKKFFKKHPDLQEYDDMVDEEAARLAAEIGNRKVDPEKAMLNLAKRTRSRIEAFKRKVSGNPPQIVTSGTPSEPVTQPQGSGRKRTMTEDERLAEYMEEEKKARNARMGRPAPR